MSHFTSESFEQAFELNNVVFGPSEKYNRREFWEEKLSKNGRIYVVDQKGFLVVHNRLNQINNHDDSLSEHIWLAGVVPTCRNSGIMKELFRLAVNEMSLPIVTIRTGQAFPNMKNWIERIGFEVMESYEDGSALYQISLDSLKSYLSS